jgi:hypothetical protein
MATVTHVRKNEVQLFEKAKFDLTMSYTHKISDSVSRNLSQTDIHHDYHKISLIPKVLKQRCFIQVSNLIHHILYMKNTRTHTIFFSHISRHPCINQTTSTYSSGQKSPPWLISASISARGLKICVHILCQECRSETKFHLDC